MPAPKLIADAESAVRRARNAAQNLGANVTPGLATAEGLLAEVRFFAYAASDGDGPRSEHVERLISAILGYRVEVHGLSHDLNQGKAYSRLAR